MTETYESIRAGARGPGVDEWKRVDKARSALAALYRSLAEDDTRTPEYKTERAWTEYEKTKARIGELAPEARRQLLKSAESLERMSIPRPEGEGLLTEDTNKLLLTAHERSRIEGRIGHSRESATKGPFEGRNPQDILREEYERGLEEGGPGGGATVRAVVGLVRDWGLDIDAVVDARRKASHRGALEDARSKRVWADMVGTSVPKPPFKRDAPSKNIGTYTRAGEAAAFSSASTEKGTIFKKKRRPSWK